MTTIVASVPRLLRAPTADLDAHLAEHGELPRGLPAGVLLEQVRASGLTGRGGAAFPVAHKLDAVAAAGRTRRRRPVVVANGAEGEPLSAKDRVLMCRAPHLVLDGLQVAADTVGAGRAVVRAADAGAVAALDGGPALPSDRPVHVTQVGVAGRPTLVQNVETLAHLALVARRGSAWFRGAGTAAEPGTALVTLGGAVDAPGVVEVPYGMPLADLLALAGSTPGRAQAVLIGGYHGTWVDGAATADFSAAGLAPWGGAPGAAVVAVLPAGACGLRETAAIVAYLAGQSARRCGPCLNGLPALAAVMADLAAARGAPAAQAAHAEARRLCGLVQGRDACAHPDGTARLVASALRTFEDETAAHCRGTCSGGGR